MKIRIHNHEFNVDPEHRDFWQLAAGDQWEPVTFDIFDRMLTKITTFVDVGAWIGPTAIYAERLAKEVHAIEPDPVAFSYLKENFTGPKYRLAIADRDGTLRLGNPTLGDSMTRIGSGENAFTTLCYTLRRFVDYKRFRDPLFIKIDTEGSEELILRDLDFFADRKPTVHLSLHPQWWRDPAAIEDKLSRMDALYDQMAAPTPDTRLYWMNGGK